MSGFTSVVESTFCSLSPSIPVLALVALFLLLFLLLVSFVLLFLALGLCYLRPSSLLPVIEVKHTSASPVAWETSGRATRSTALKWYVCGSTPQTRLNSAMNAIPLTRVKRRKHLPRTTSENPRRVEAVGSRNFAEV